MEQRTAGFNTGEQTWRTPASGSPRCVHEWIEEQTACTPDRVAVDFAGNHLTYRELNGRANQLARFLASRGVGPDVPVGLCLDRGLDMVVGVLGILKAGGALLPLDPALPRERLEFMLHDCMAQVIVTQMRFLEKLPVSGGQNREGANPIFWEPRLVCLDRVAN